MEKVRAKDYMMIYTMVRQSESPGNEQRGMWNSVSADENGSRNYASIKNPEVDKLVEKIVNAKSRKDLVIATKALDWVLKQGWYVIPTGYSDKWRIAYWDRFAKPANPPQYALGFGSWWIDTEKDEKINKAVKR